MRARQQRSSQISELALDEDRFCFSLPRPKFLNKARVNLEDKLTLNSFSPIGSADTTMRSRTQSQVKNKKSLTERMPTIEEKSRLQHETYGYFDVENPLTSR